MADKKPTIPSLLRISAQSEAKLLECIRTILEEGDPERITEYFSRLNIPRSEPEAERVDDPQLPWEAGVTTFEDEARLAEAMSRFQERHHRKLKWHAGHPSLDTVDATIRIYRAMCLVIELRIRRSIALLSRAEVLTPEQWGMARELLNGAYRDFRSATQVISSTWPESLLGALDREEVKPHLEGIPQEIRSWTRRLGALRAQAEEARANLSVQPDGFPPISPPRYFGGDLLDAGPWRSYLGELGGMADNLRQHMEL